MGIESDQLVFDYLSRVGDLAQRSGLSSGERMRLVAGLRNEVDGQREDSVAGVKRVLARLGTPEEVVAAAGGRPAEPDPGPGAETAGGPGSGPGPSVPSQRPTARDRLSGLSRSALSRSGPSRSGLPWRAGPAVGKIPGPRGRSAPRETERAEPAELGEEAALPPHLAGADELGDGGSEPDWWRLEPGPYGPGETVPGFSGGIEIPEMWERPEKDRPLSLEKPPEAAGGPGKPLAGFAKALGGKAPGEKAAAAGAEKADGAGEGAAGEAGGEREEREEATDERRGLRRLFAASVPLVVLPVVALLAVGAAIGSWVALGAGWLLAYSSRRLSRAEAKFAALGVPGLALAGLVVWLWGRLNDRWGAPIPRGGLGPEVAEALPTLARVAAVASALFLLWRMRRGPR